ncbi:NAD(+) kinase [Thalassotalea ponticola]|uniref:NAD(+) kinase n=1 Tax=Thalassotalea ponticola TaxID=1523392 RepID=UPI0025B4EC6D|nr:NAD(+) kinase [Thalassotalea ponticola]MDN3651748.1 NAD(+) kinase [Thalassotalea ponticola]
MSRLYKTIGLIGKPNHDGALATINTLHEHLTDLGYQVMVETKVSEQLNFDKSITFDIVDIGKQAQLAIVVGGDGYMLGAARVLANHDIAVIGVNRGNLGFLTDLSPDNVIEPLNQILAGNSNTEHRSLLFAEVYRHGQLKSANAAMNEAVLHPGKVASMMEFAVYLDDTFMFSQRSDGIIISTPTGSTAYSMSAGGPIMTPTLNALSLVPMFPHTLSSRPIVVDGDSHIKIVIGEKNHEELQVSCDGHVILAAMPGDEIHIKKSKYTLRLVHPLDHDYFNVLRTKLGWGNKVY